MIITQVKYNPASFLPVHKDSEKMYKYQTISGIFLIGKICFVVKKVPSNKNDTNLYHSKNNGLVSFFILALQVTYMIPFWYLCAFHIHNLYYLLSNAG